MKTKLLLLLTIFCTSVSKLSAQDINISNKEKHIVYKANAVPSPMKIDPNTYKFWLPKYYKDIGYKNYADLGVPHGNVSPYEGKQPDGTIIHKSKIENLYFRVYDTDLIDKQMKKISQKIKNLDDSRKKEEAKLREMIKNSNINIDELIQQEVERRLNKEIDKRVQTTVNQILRKRNVIEPDLPKRNSFPIWMGIMLFLAFIGSFFFQKK